MIALGGLSAIRSIALDHVKQIVIAILDSEHLLQYSSAAEAAADFHVAFTDIAKKVEAAAGMMQAAASFR